MQVQSTERHLKCQVSLLLLSSSCYLQHVNIATVIHSKYSFAFALNNHLTRLLLYTPYSHLPPLALSLSTVVVMHAPSFSCSLLSTLTQFTRR